MNQPVFHGMSTGPMFNEISKSNGNQKVLTTDSLHLDSAWHHGNAEKMALVEVLRRKEGARRFTNFQASNMSLIPFVVVKYCNSIFFGGEINAVKPR